MRTGSYEDGRAAEDTFRTVTAPAIAKALSKIDSVNGPWKVNQPNPDAGHWQKFTTGSDDISISFSSYNNKVNVAANWPKMPDGSLWRPRHGTESPSINMSPTKSPDQMAKDIARRFLTDYRTLKALADTDIASQQKYRAETTDLFAQLVAAGAPYIKQDGRNDDKNSEKSASLYNLPGVSYGNMRVSGKSVRFDNLSVSGEFARRMLALMKDYATEFPADKGDDDEN